MQNTVLGKLKTTNCACMSQSESMLYSSTSAHLTFFKDCHACHPGPSRELAAALSMAVHSCPWLSVVVQLSTLYPFSHAVRKKDISPRAHSEAPECGPTVRNTSLTTRCLAQVS